MTVAAIDTRRESGVVLAAFAADAVTATMIEQVASYHWPGATVVEGGLNAAATYLDNTRAPDLLVVDLGNSEDPLEQLLTLADSCEASTQVVALGTVNDLGLYKQFVAAGVADYLVKPLSPEDLETALLAAAFREQQVIEAVDMPLGKIVVTIGARGGVGATTIATNGAWMLAEEQKQKVVLVDLDLQFGSTALSLDLVPAGGMIETLRNPDRVDGRSRPSAGTRGHRASRRGTPAQLRLGLDRYSAFALPRERQCHLGCRAHPCGVRSVSRRHARYDACGQLL